MPNLVSELLVDLRGRSRELLRGGVQQFSDTFEWHSGLGKRAYANEAGRGRRAIAPVAGRVPR